MATQHYIPAGTSVLVTKADGEQVWYETKEEITLDGQQAQATCPRTGRAVYRVTHKGLEVFFAGESVAVREVEDTGDIDEKVVSGLRFCMLQYDIPVNAEFDNPSGFLRRIGVRTTQSVWIIPEGSIPYPLLARMTEAKVAWHVFKFDASEGKNLAERALATLRQEIADHVARSRASREAAEAQLEATTDSAERAEARFTRRAESIKERYETLVEDFKVAAARFGIREGALNLREANNAVQVITASMEERARLYLQAARTARELGSTGDALAKGAEEGAVPAGVLADYIEETAVTAEASAQAQALRTAFDGEPETFDLVTAEERADG